MRTVQRTIQAHPMRTSMSRQAAEEHKHANETTVHSAHGTWRRVTRASESVELIADYSRPGTMTADCPGPITASTAAHSCAPFGDTDDREQGTGNNSHPHPAPGPPNHEPAVCHRTSTFHGSVCGYSIFLLSTFYILRAAWRTWNLQLRGRAPGQSFLTKKQVRACYYSPFSLYIA
jgi:hypothetical protein